MREIKFRGKNKDIGWVYGNLIYDNISDKYWIDLSINESEKIDGGLHIYAVEVIPETVGQYTGLKDKNGKEIYSGDIVKITCVNEIEICEVRYDYENTCFRMYYKGKHFLDFAIEETNLYEVIGNTTDNPELLEA